MKHPTKVNPLISARLPFTIAKAQSDYVAAVDTSLTLGIKQIDYTEGLLIDYRHFDAVGVEYISVLVVALTKM